MQKINRMIDAKTSYSCNADAYSVWQKAGTNIIDEIELTAKSKIVANRTLHRAIVVNTELSSLYAELCLANPELKWACAAGYAMIGLSELLDDVEKYRDYRENLEKYKKEGKVVESPITMKFIFWEIKASNYINIAIADKLANAGILIFKEFYWQNLVYQHCGVDSVLKMLNKQASTYRKKREKYELLKSRNNRSRLEKRKYIRLRKFLANKSAQLKFSRIETSIKSWELFAKHEYEEAALMLAVAEQKYLLQPEMYGGLAGKIMGNALTPIATSPITREGYEYMSFSEHVNMLKNSNDPDVASKSMGGSYDFSDYEVRMSWMTAAIRRMFEYFRNEPEDMKQSFEKLFERREILRTID